MIELKKITKIYNSGGNSAIGLNDVSLKFKAGEFVRITGPSGSGKTTLLNVVSGMDTYDEGDLILFDEEASNFSSSDFENYRRNNVAFIFQNYQLIDSYSVLSNVMLELRFKSMSKRDSKKRAIELLNSVGLSHRLHTKAIKLSGGEKQRVVIARALASDANIIACDEPTGNLDSKSSKEIVEILKKVSTNKLVLFVTHEPAILDNIATRTVVIKDGQVESDVKLAEVKEVSYQKATGKSVDFKTQMFVAIKNILSTPKKSIFLLAIFLIVVIGFLSQMSQIKTVFDDESTSAESPYSYKVEDNRLIVYKNSKDEKTIQIKNGYVIENDYILDQNLSGSYLPVFNLDISNPELALWQQDFEYKLGDVKITSGRNATSSNEIVVADSYILRDYLYNSSLEDLNSGKFKVTFESKEYTIVGLFEQEDISFTPQVKFYNNQLPKIPFDETSSKFSEIEYSPMNDATLFNNKVSTFYRSLRDDEKNIAVFLKPGTNINDVELKLGGVNIPLTNANVSFDSNITEPIINVNYVENFANNNVYRYSVFFDKKTDAVDQYKKLSKTNFVVYPDNFKADDSSSDYYISVAVIVISIFMLGLILIGLAFFISAITSLILKTSIRDFTIMRIFGLNKKNVFLITFMQIGLIMFSAFLMVLIATILLMKIGASTSVAFESMYYYITRPQTGIVFVVCLILFTLFLTYRFNKKLFSTTASAGLREGF